MQEVGKELKQCAFMLRDTALDHMMTKSLDPESIFKFLHSTLLKKNIDSSKASASMNLVQHNQ